MSLPAASLVGDGGVVYAVDVSDEYLQKLRKKASELGLKNLYTVRTRAEDLDGVPDCAVDRAVFMLSLHHIEDKKQALRQLRKKLKKNGLAMIYDPISSRTMGHGTNPTNIITLLRQEGFELQSLSKGFLFWTALFSPL